MKHSNRIESNHSCIFFFMWSSSSLDRFFSLSFSLTLHRRFFRTFILVAYYVPLVKFISYAFLTTSWSSRLNHRICWNATQGLVLKRLASCCVTLFGRCAFFVCFWRGLLLFFFFFFYFSVMFGFNCFPSSFHLSFSVCSCVQSQATSSTPHSERLLRSTRWYTITVL